MKLLVLPGDGIGPDIAEATRLALAALDRKFSLGLEIEEVPIGLASLKTEGTTWPSLANDRLHTADGVVMAPVDTYEYPEGQVNPSSMVRRSLDLYANIRPARRRLPAQPGEKPIDLVLVRENTEGFYADRNMAMGSGEFRPTEDVALAVRKITRSASTRIARTAFEAARKRRSHVTAVHKANVLKLSDGLFLEAVRAVAKEYPDVELDEVIIDAMAALLVRDPGRFDVVVTTNMYGDILSDEAGEIAGGLGIAPALNAGADHAVAQAVHGSAPDIAGQGIANPSALMLSTAMLLTWLGDRHGKSAFTEAAQALDQAVDMALANPATRTRDLGGSAGTMAFAETVATAVSGG
ncbi:isocitrate/isopropylmalate dehydrogenase family protein [Fodinicurvata sp. EGI_FJ10296]|uniref:isocitrate/isopropylmalate dehydrogenase family protein n=1 Tax=Fodinicurvata sp. EGI_FJ10296 TaxID=3231908 RepID=UPI00345116F6